MKDYLKTITANVARLNYDNTRKANKNNFIKDKIELINKVYEDIDSFSKKKDFCFMNYEISKDDISNSEFTYLIEMLEESGFSIKPSAGYYMASYNFIISWEESDSKDGTD